MSAIEAHNIKDKITEEEWRVRVDLAATYRLVAFYGWDDLIFTHISARVPGPDEHFLINPYGLMFDEITASSLVKVNLEGEILLDSHYDINPAGFTIHSAVHAVREDAACVMHLHTVDGIAVSIQEAGLLPLSQQSLFALSSMSYHDYEGVALNPDEKSRLQADLGDATSMILRNHGLLTVDQTIADTFLRMFVLQRACEIQIRALAGDQKLLPIPQTILDGIVTQSKTATLDAGGLLAWPGLLRKLDRLDPGYRT